MQMVKDKVRGLAGEWRTWRSGPDADLVAQELLAVVVTRCIQIGFYSKRKSIRTKSLETYEVEIRPHILRRTSSALTSPNRLSKHF